MQSLSLDDGPNDEETAPPASVADESEPKGPTALISTVPTSTDPPTTLADDAPDKASNNGSGSSNSESEGSEEDENGDGIAAADKPTPSAPSGEMEYPDTSIDVSYDRSSSMRIHTQTSQDSVSRQASEAGSQDAAGQHMSSKGISY